MRLQTDPAFGVGTPPKRARTDIQGGFQFKTVKISSASRWGGRKLREKTLNRMAAEGWEYVETRAGYTKDTLTFRRRVN